MEAPERKALMDTAADAVHAAEAVLETAAGGEIRVLSWMSHDLKLELDRLCEEAMIDRIRDQYPDDSILTEESGLFRGTTERTWVLDPLDGTVNYSHGLPFYAISAACASCRPEILHKSWKTHVEAAAVSLPPYRETFLATREGGATRNGVALRLAERGEMDKALVCLGVSVKDGALPFSLRMIEAFAASAQKIRSLGAIAGELACLAAGRIDALVQKGTNIWDFLAAGLLIMESGGRFEAEEFAPGRWQVVAGNQGLFDRVDAVVRQT
jgi:myo-inositol-1(or 4)-monophosphatase